MVLKLSKFHTSILLIQTVLVIFASHTHGSSIFAANITNGNQSYEVPYVVNATDRNLNVTFENGQTIAVYSNLFSSTLYCPENDEAAICQIEFTLTASPVVDIEVNTTYFVATTRGTWHAYTYFAQNNASEGSGGTIGDNADIEGTTNGTANSGNATTADLSILNTPQWNIDLLCNSPVGGDCGVVFSLHGSATFDINNNETYYITNK